MKTRSTPASFTYETVNFGSVFASLFIHLFIYSKVCTKQVVNMATNTRRNDSGIFWWTGTVYDWLMVGFGGQALFMIG